MSEGQFLALFVLAGLVVGQGWAALGSAPAAAAALLAAIAALAWLQPGQSRVSFADARGLPPPPAPRRSLAVTAAAFLPTAVFLALTWRQEFPLSGDQAYHLNAHRWALRVWLWIGPRMAALALALWYCARRRWLRWALPAALAVLWFWNYPLRLPYTSARYPGLSYFCALPLTAAARLAGGRWPQLAPRVWSALTIPLWLLALRPWLLRRWPDARVLPLCLFLFWQKDTVWLFTSAYLEPLALILILLAMERALDEDPARALDACLLAGAAALAKEQAALALPFCWLAARPWALDARGRLRALALGAAASAPFVFYLLERRAAGVTRGFSPASLGELLSGARAAEAGRRLLFTFHVPGLLAAALCLAALAWALRAPGPRRATLAWLAAAGLLQMLFFYADHGSTAWTGYPRFQLLGWGLLGAGLLALGPSLEAPGSAPVWALTAALGLLNAGALAPALAAATLPDPYRSFTLHYDDPLFLDIGALERRARAEGALRDVDELVLVDRFGVYDIDSWYRGYPDLRARYRLGTMKAGPAPAPGACRCRAPDLALLAPFKLAVGLDSGRPDPQEKAFQASCEQAMRATCARVVEDRHGPDTLGVLGAGLKDSVVRRAPPR